MDCEILPKRVKDLTMLGILIQEADRTSYDCIHLR